MSKITIRQVTEMKRLRAQGYSYRLIAEKVGVSISRAAYYANDGKRGTIDKPKARPKFHKSIGPEWLGGATAASLMAKYKISASQLYATLNELGIKHRWRARLSADDKRAMIADYMAHESLKRICRKYKCNKHTIYDVLNKHGVTFRWNEQKRQRRKAPPPMNAASMSAPSSHEPVTDVTTVPA